MTVSSRTPEGLPNRCPICGAHVTIEPSFPPGDAPCPSCGQLLWWLQEHLPDRLGLDRPQINLDTSLTDMDSLAIVELVMELEEEFDLSVSDKAASQIQTVQDLIAYIQRRRKPPGE